MGDESGADDRYLPVPCEPEAVLDEPGPEEPTGITRRQFLTLTAGGAGAVGAMSRGQWLRHARRTMAVIAAAPGQLPPLIPDLVIEAERDVDLVSLRFLFFGFSGRPASPPLTPPALVPIGSDHFIVVEFPPQAIGEAVYPAVDPAGNLLGVDPAPIRSDVAEHSTLAFALPPGKDIPLPTMTVADLLDWKEWKLLVPSVARTENINRETSAADPRRPNLNETRIECPYALYLSPTDAAVFRTTQQSLSAETTECWGATLTGDPQVVATYARDYPGSGVDDATAVTYIDYWNKPTDAVP